MDRYSLFQRTSLYLAVALTTILWASGIGWADAPAAAAAAPATAKPATAELKPVKAATAPAAPPATQSAAKAAPAPSAPPPAAAPSPGAATPVKPAATAESKAAPAAAPAPAPPAAAPSAALTTPAAAPGAAPAQPHLRFQFRFQPWADVLQWFARQADLSLVLDAPPPGTFNYSDTHEYTPSEAIDLLNEVLQTKDFTLIRRGRMLMVINLKNGLPEGLVPHVTLDDLDKRGKFELVTVQFPLGKRPVDTVVKEITPLLGKYGKVVSLPSSAQVQVTDMAAVMHAVQALIESIPEPAPSETSGTPVMEHYPLKPADPQAVESTFKILLPKIKVACDEQTDQIHVFATPVDQALAKQLIEDMRGGTAGKPQLELYPISDALASQILTFLKTVVPKAILSLDPRTGKIAAWAPKSDQEIIKRTIEKLSGEAIEGEKPGLEVYHILGVDPAATLQLLHNSLPDAKLALDRESNNLLVWATPSQHRRVAAALAKLGNAPGREGEIETFRLTKANPSTTLALLQSLAPRAKISLDSGTNSLLVLGSPEDRKVVKEVLDRLQPMQPDQNTPEFNYHVFKQRAPADLVTTLKSAVPQATLKLDPEGMRLSIVATPSDQAFLKVLLDRYEKTAPPEEKNQLVLYPATPEQKARFQAVLSTASADLPGIKVVADSDPTQLAIWAKPEQHKTIQHLLDQLRQEPPEPEVFRLTKANPSTTLSLLQTLAPHAKITLDSGSNSLIVLGSAEDRKVVKQILDRLQPTQPDQNTPEFNYYSFKQRPPADLLTVLKTAVPQAILKLETDGKRLTIAATPADYAFLKVLLERYEKTAPPEEKNQLVTYAVTPEQKARFQAVLTAAASDLPGIKVVADTEPTQLSIWAKPAEQDVVAGIIEQLRKEPSAELKAQLVVYPVRSTDPANVATLLQPIYPHAKFVPDKKTHKIAVWARPVEHAAIKAAIDEIDSGTPGAMIEKVQSYSSPTTDPSVAISVLEDLLPNAKFQPDNRSGTIVAWASPRDQEQIQRTLDEMRVENSAEKKSHMEIYPLNTENAPQVVSFVQSLVPTARVTLDPDTQNLAVWGTKKDQEVVRDAVAKFTGGASSGAGGGPGGALETARQVEVYALTKADPSSTMTLLKTLVPRAKVSLDAQTRRLIVVANIADQNTVRGTLDQLQPAKPGPNDAKLQFHAIRKQWTGTMISGLQALVPTARITLDPDGTRLMVVAPPAEQELIQKSIEETEKSAAVQGVEQLVVVPLKKADPTVIIATLTKMFPQAQWTPDKKGRRIIAVTRFEDPAAVRAAVEQLDGGPSGGAGATVADMTDSVMVYPVPQADPRVVAEMLQEVFPDMTITADYRNQAVLARGPQGRQKAVENLIARMGQTDERLRPKVVSYPTGAVNPVTLRTLIAQLVPNATLTADPRTRTLVVLATPQEHERIRAAVENMGKPESPATAASVASYMLPTTGAATAVQLLRSALPDAQFGVGNDPRQLIAYARPEDQVVIKAAVEQMESEKSLDEKRVLAVYPLAVKDAAALTQIIDPNTLRNAKIVSLPDRQGLMVWAEPKEQAAIKKAIEQFQKEMPTAMERTTKVYHFQRAEPRTAISVLAPLAPSAQIAFDAESHALVVNALPEDHAKLAAAIAEIDAEHPESTRTMAIYTLSTTGAAAARQLLSAAVPYAQLSVGTDPRQLVAFASPSEHAVIKAAVDQLASEKSPNEKRVMAVYPLAMKDATALRQILDPNTLRNANIVDLPDRQGLLVWAELKEQATIKKAIEQFQKEMPKAMELTTKTYHFERADPRTAYSALAPLVPSARIGLDLEAHSLVVSAVPEDQAKIAAAVADIDAEHPESTRSVASYMLSNTGAANAVQLLRSAMPNVQLSVGADPRQLIAYARPSDQAIIKAAVDQMESEKTLDERRVMTVYPLDMKDAAALHQIFDQTTMKNARFAPLPDRQGLLVWAEPKEQAAIKKALEQFQHELPKAKEATTKVYRFQRADPRAAMTALATLLPNAKFALDAEAHALVVSALTEEHEKIAAAVKEMDQDDAATGVKVRVHPVSSADPQNLVTVLQGLFRGRKEVQVAADAQHDAIVAVGTPEQHAVIDKLIEQVEKGLPGEGGATLALYSLQNVEGRGIIPALTKLLERKGGKVELTVDPFGRQLVALARPEQQKVLQATLESMRGGKQNFDILQLDMLEPSTAETAINELFADDSVHAPDVQVDRASDQVFVRGTDQQLKKIRELLIKMGETGLRTAGDTGSESVRTIPFHGDAEAVVEELQRMWPQLRKNPLHVVAPSVVPVLRQPNDQKPPSEKSPAKDPPPIKNKQSFLDHGPSAWLACNLAAMLFGQVAGPPTPAAAPAKTVEKPAPFLPAAAQPKSPAPAATLPRTAAPPATTAAPPAHPSPSAPSQPQKLPPVTVTISGNKIIVSSKDPEALDQVESLLRSMTRQSQLPGHNFSFYLLKHASATKVAETLQTLFRTGRQTQRGQAFGASRGYNRVVVVADERTNSLLVQANRMDQATIEAYLKVIDSDEPPASVREMKPLTVALHNSKAARIEQILRTIFHAQLTPTHASQGAGGLINPELAVDEVTNSLIITAPPALAQQIAEFARSLDTSAQENAASEIAIIPLKNTNADRVQQVLNLMLQHVSGAHFHGGHR